jgi:hypothetical protein
MSDELETAVKLPMRCFCGEIEMWGSWSGERYKERRTESGTHTDTKCINQWGRQLKKLRKCQQCGTWVR